MNGTLTLYGQHAINFNTPLFLNFLGHLDLPMLLTTMQKLISWILDKAIDAACRRYRRDEIIFPQPSLTGNRFTK